MRLRPDKKQTRREEAVKRENARLLLSDEEQLEIIKNRRGESKKEVARLSGEETN